MYVNKAILLVNALLLTSGTALAATTYTQPADFLANVSAGSYLETFDRPGLSSTSAPSYNFSSNGFAYTISATLTTGAADRVFRDTQYIGPDTVGSTLNINFTSGNVTAIGGSIFGAGVSNFQGIYFFVSHPVRIRLSDGTDTTFTPADQASAFLGFTSTIPITSMIVNASPQTRFVAIDSLRVGAAVPEPESWLIMGIGLATLALISRRKRGIPNAE